MVAQSHAVVENLFRDVDRRRRRRRAGGQEDQHAPTPVAGDRRDGVRRRSSPTTTGCVIGGTAWDFANASRVPRGQPRPARRRGGRPVLPGQHHRGGAAPRTNLLLLGDPQQLPQVSQGTHPEPVDRSALGWLVDGQPHAARRARLLPRLLLPHAPRGVRGRCRGCPTTAGCARARTSAPPAGSTAYAPGVRVLTVDHDGNSTDSPEEADAIVAEIERLLGATWTDEDGTTAARAEHVLVVTPYNAQVVTLRAQARRGRTDRRRGGHGRQVPGQAGAGRVRLDDGVLGRRRAARDLVPAQQESAQRRRQPGQVRRVIVRSPLLTDYLPSTPDRLIELGAFLSLPLV